MDIIRRYELIVILDPDLDDEAVALQLKKIAETVTAHKGVVELEDKWGKRPLKFPINKKSYGNMVLMVFSGDTTLVADLRRQLKIADSVMRCTIVKKDKYAPDLLKAAEAEAETTATGRDAEKGEKVSSKVSD